MPGLHRSVIDAFWELCNAAFETWAARRCLFEENPDIEKLRTTHCGPYLDHLNELTQQQVLQRIAKLHDPAGQFGNTNLSIALVMNTGSWDRETGMKLSELHGKLEAFATLVRTARNKLIAHNDHATIQVGQPLGQFPLNEDIEYFERLQEFMNLIAGELRPFNDLIRNDVLAFVETLLRGSTP